MLQAGWSRVQAAVGARFSGPIQTSPEAHPVTCAVGAGSLSHGYSSQGMMLTS